MRVFFTIIFLVFFSAQSFADGAYRLKKGDTVTVTVWQDKNLNRQILVRPDGRISFPLAGSMQAAGRSPESLGVAIKQRLAKFYNDDLDVTVSVVSVDETSDRVIYVTGQVTRPGPFEIKKPTTILQAISLSGGLGPFAAERRILIHRKIKGQDIVIPFDYGKFESGVDIAGNIYLRDGDVVVVPERGLFE